MLRRTLQKLPLRSAPPLTLTTAYAEKFSRHRSILPLYDLYPTMAGQCFVAPNATLIGEVILGDQVIIWYNCVLRGDINQINIMDEVYIGENTVIHTAASLPTGIQASVTIAPNVYIGPRCTLYSCTIEEFAHIGEGSVIMEGARVEHNAMVAPGSVVPPGRLIPAKQLWGGNPVQYIRDLYEPDDAHLKDELDYQATNASIHEEQFEEFGHAHIYHKDQ